MLLSFFYISFISGLIVLLYKGKNISLKNNTLKPIWYANKIFNKKCYFIKGNMQKFIFVRSRSTIGTRSKL